MAPYRPLFRFVFIPEVSVEGFNASSASNSSPLNSSPVPKRLTQTVPASTAIHNRIKAFTKPAFYQRPNDFPARLGSALQKLWGRLAQALTAANQPQVSWWRDAQGHDHYRVYDPYRQQTHDFATAREVRVWLEQRYYE